MNRTDSLPDGRYLIWRDPVTPLAEVDMAGGAVTEYEWPTSLMLVL
jgi:hypothetical protein